MVGMLHIELEEIKNTKGYEALAYGGKNFKVQVYGRPRRGSGGGGGGAPRASENFSKICKRFLKEFAQMDYFRLFSKYFKNPALNFREFGPKNTIGWEIFEKFLIKNQ